MKEYEKASKIYEYNVILEKTNSQTVEETAKAREEDGWVNRHISGIFFYNGKISFCAENTTESFVKMCKSLRHRLKASLNKI